MIVGPYPFRWDVVVEWQGSELDEVVTNSKYEISNRYNFAQKPSCEGFLGFVFGVMLFVLTCSTWLFYGVVLYQAVFYLDHNFLENMLTMFRKVNAKERVVGFYSTGPQIRPNDLRIHSLVKRFVPPGSSTPPVFVIIDVRPDRESIPTTAYKVVEEVDSTKSSGGSSKNAEVRKSFAHVSSLIGALEAEEVGVEHLLRDINDPTVSTVASLIKAKMSGLSALTEKLVEMKDYLEAVVEGRMKVNQDIVANMQTILNLLPNLNVEELVRAMLVKTNDMHMVIYLSALIRSVIALHDLVNNKIKYNLEVGEDEAGKKEGESSKEKKVDESEKKKEDEGEEKKEDDAKK